MLKNKIQLYLLISGFLLINATSNATAITIGRKKANHTILQMIISTPQDAIHALMRGNDRYVKDSSIFPDINYKRMVSTAGKQHPFACVVSCSDSRVPIEILFDQGIGDIFVIRVAGNNVNDDIVKGSIEYAVEELGVKTIVVMGHESCGAVTGAVENLKPTDEIGKVLQAIRLDIKPYIGKMEKLTDAIKLNVNAQITRIDKLPAIAKAIKNGKVSVVGAYYNLHNGSVSFM